MLGFQIQSQNILIVFPTVDSSTLNMSDNTDQPFHFNFAHGLLKFGQTPVHT